MKKILIIIMCFVLVGCTNKISLDFNKNVDAKIEFSFTENEFIKHEKYEDLEDINIAEEVDTIINEVRPINNNYDELFNEVKYNSNNGRYEGEYSYSYTYKDFVNNAIFTRCFEYSAVEEDDNKIYIYLKGTSDCAPFELRVNANGKMLSNNANKKEKNEYIWKVKEMGNDIQFNISRKSKVGKVFSFSNFFYIILMAAILFGIIYLKKKTQK